MVDSRFEFFVSMLADLPDVNKIWEATESLSQSFGFSGCSLVQAQKGIDGIKSPKILSNFSEEFQTAYKNEGLGEIDPFLLFTCKGLTAKKMVTDDLSSFPHASPVHQLFLDHAAENGAIGNLGVPVRSNDNQIFGGWVFSCDDTEKQFDLLEEDHGREIHLAAVLAYERMTALGLGSVLTENPLSARERECLIWLCAGLRVAMIADKLSLSNSAINLYIANAKRKLGAKTREHAIARAIISGEITL